MFGRDFERDFGCMVITSMVFIILAGVGIGIVITLLIQHIF